MLLKQLRDAPTTVSPHAELAVYQVQYTASHLCMMAAEVSGERDHVFVRVPQFTALPPEARQFNLSIIRSARQIGFSAAGEMLDFYYNRHHLEPIIVNV